MAENNKRTEQNSAPHDNGGARVKATRGGVPGRRATKHAFNVFDLILVLLVVLVIVLAIVGIRLTDLWGTTGGKQVRLSYTLTAYGVDAAFEHAFASGDAVYDVDGKVTIGTVKQTPVVTAHKVAVLENGNAAAATMKTYPNLVDVTLTVEVIASYNEGVGYTVGGRAIRIGEAYALRLPNYVGQATCVAINGAQAVAN